MSLIGLETVISSQELSSVPTVLLQVSDASSSLQESDDCVPGFCFDSLCRDVIMDDRRMEDYNFDSKVSKLIIIQT